MIERGVEIIVLASCIKNGNPIGFPCPHRETMKEAISKKAGEKIKIMDYTH